MDKRELLKNAGMGLAAAAAVVVPNVANAATEPDWRDELLHEHTGWRVHYGEESGITKEGEDSILNWSRTKYIYIERKGVYDSDKNWTPIDKYSIEHYQSDWERGGNFVSTYLEGHNSEFNTLKEAYLYAKELKQKYYT